MQEEVEQKTVNLAVTTTKLTSRDVPEDYEIIMEITTGYDTKAGTSIAYINGVKREEELKEIRLMN